MKKKVTVMFIFLIFSSLCACQKKSSEMKNNTEFNDKSYSQEVEAKESLKEQPAKGYDLPIDSDEQEEAVADCKIVMELISEIYRNADKGSSSNIVIGDETIYLMQEKIQELKCPVYFNKIYSNMENHEEMEQFLNAASKNKSGEITLYNVHSDGGIGRNKFIYDGKDMYVLGTKAFWNDKNKAMISDVTYTRIKEWRYTDKGWFCYELCVPEPPEVTEIVNGSCMIRVKPMKEELQEISKKCVLGLGYQGNNLLCSDWDSGHLENLDYNGMYDYLYSMKYQKKVSEEDYLEGIPAEEFENLIMEYLPVTAEQIRTYAAFDIEKETYCLERLGCSNYAPTYFGTSVPEVTEIRENEDGTLTLTVDAVCEMILCDDAVITHELTIRFLEDGTFQYLKNKILNEGIRDIPDYQYRIRRE